jgi:Flp pilus assembly protein TadB
MDLMERLVCDWKLLGCFAWGVPLALFVAVKFLGAPPITIAFVLLGEPVLVMWLRGRAMRRHPERWPV